jgi:hypothetical protein
MKEQIKKIVEQFYSNGMIGAYTLMKQNGLGDGEYMAMFWAIVDEREHTKND